MSLSSMAGNSSFFSCKNVWAKRVFRTTNIVQYRMPPIVGMDVMSMRSKLISNGSEPVAAGAAGDLMMFACWHI